MKKDNAHLFLPLVQALADGKTLQTKVDQEWVDFDKNADVFFSSNFEDYRIKPNIIKGTVRLAQFKKEFACEQFVTASSSIEERIESHPSFIKWLTDRIEYEIEE